MAANCRFCKLPIVLVPSAQERARKFGGSPSDYTELFKAHSACEVRERNEQVLALIERNRTNG